MRKRKLPLYSQNHVRFPGEEFLQGKELYEQGKASITYFDPLSGEAHGNVEEGGKRFAIGMSFSLEGSLSGASCSCRGNSNHPCRHMAALLLRLEEEVGENCEASLPDFQFYLKTISPYFESKGSLYFLQKGLKELKKRSLKWDWDEAAVCSGIKAILKSAPTYSGFGEEEDGGYLAPFLESLPFPEDFLSNCLSFVPPLLSQAGKKGFFLACLKGERERSLALERFDAGLTNGSSYDLLNLFLGEEERLLSLLPPYSLHLLCRADFRFKAYPVLSKVLLRQEDGEGLRLLSENPYCALPASTWEEMGKELEKTLGPSAALPCYKKMFGLFGGDFPALCSYWRGLSEEQKRGKEGEFLSFLSSSKLLSPFLFLLGKGKEEDIPSLRLGDFPLLKEELSPFPYQPVLISKAEKALKDKNLGEGDPLYQCFLSFPCLVPLLLSPSAEAYSFLSPSLRGNYLRLLQKRGLCQRKGLTPWEDTHVSI